MAGGRAGRVLGRARALKAWAAAFAGPTWRRALIFAGVVVLVGVLGGLVWHAYVTLPVYSASEDGTVKITERAQSQIFATDALFIIIGLLAGVALGFIAWQAFKSLGWPVGVIAVGGGLAAALICWGVGVLQGPQDFAQRVAVALPGQSIPVDFELHTPSAVFVWALGAIVPVMLYANLTREDDPVWSHSRRAVAARDGEPAETQRP
ncbi:hypothetical protein [Brooklawnia cerclae]|uniref:DUF2567 domain-containing protein n=1 Tax=Brooklawnia cerclae TaxID=349934 RepID=A0ABX0SF26_9ACTN|nr:hypothetical protein [Brooklawnia cerclae]NIH56504.1 hypothetical protein [Brooklawnia cerclae]